MFVIQIRFLGWKNSLSLILDERRRVSANPRAGPVVAFGIGPARRGRIQFNDNGNLGLALRGGA